MILLALTLSPAALARFLLLFLDLGWGLYVCEAELSVLDAYAHHTALGELAE